MNTTGVATKKAAEDWANEYNLDSEHQIEDVYVDAAKDSHEEDGCCQDSTRK